MKQNKNKENQTTLNITKTKRQCLGTLVLRIAPPRPVVSQNISVSYISNVFKFVLLFYNGFGSLLVEINYFAMVFFGFEWLSLVLLRFSLVCQWLPLVLSTRKYVFSIMGFLGSRLVSTGFVGNLARCHCSGPLLPPYPPLLRVIRRSGPLWPPLGLSFLHILLSYV